MVGKRSSDEYSAEETARRRDEVIRRMANTPPQPHVTRPRKTAKPTASGRGRSKRGPSEKS